LENIRPGTEVDFAQHFEVTIIDRIYDGTVAVRALDAPRRLAPSC